jgi:hypothetical protein
MTLSILKMLQSMNYELHTSFYLISIEILMKNKELKDCNV